MTTAGWGNGAVATRRSIVGGLLALWPNTLLARADAALSCVSASATSTPDRYYFGWVRDLPQQDFRLYEAPRAIAEALPSAVDLRSSMPPVFDQGQIGSCTSNAIAGVVQYVRKKDKQGPDFVPSRLFIYFNGRYIEGDIPLDGGLRIQSGVGSLETFGVCPESEWPYDGTPADQDTHVFPSQSRAVQKPTDAEFASAFSHRALTAWRMMQRSDQLKGCIAERYPFIFGFTIYPSFFDPVTCAPRTIIPLPQPNEKPTPAGHAVVCVGYDDSTKLFTCRNSWGLKDSLGREMQDRGHFYMPYAYLENPNLTADFWTIRTINAIVQ